MGGHSVYPDEDHFTAMNADGIIQESGVGEFSQSDISKVLAGKSVYVAPTISYNNEIMTGQSKTADIESMLQLTYLYFTDPRIDESAFNSYITKRKDLYENLIKEPENFFFDKYYRIKAQNHPRGDYLPTADDWKGIDFERAIEVYRDRFSDAGNFTFIMVGSFDVEKVRPLIEQYIASLPTLDRNESFIDLNIRPPKEKTKEKVLKGNDPKSLAILYFEKEEEWNEYDAFLISSLNDILRMKYIDILREEMSGVYSVRVRAKLEKIPYDHSWMQIMIPCAPENADSLIHTAIAEIAKIQQEGVDDENINKARETRRRSIETQIQNNKFWLNAIQGSLMLGSGFDDLTREKFIDKISSEEIQRVAKKYFDINKYLQVVLYPETETAGK
jgi:zinc protease